MNDVIVVENRVDMHCIRHLHLMSNVEFGREILCSYGAPNGVAAQESGVWHLRAIYPFRGVLDVRAACVEEKSRRLVVWNLDGYGSVREAIFDACRYFIVKFDFLPGFVFMKKLPKSIENGEYLDGLMLFEAEWMLERCVAVGGRQH